MSDQPSPHEEETVTTAASKIEPARTHQEAAELLRRPFAPGAIGFFAADRVELNGSELGGARIVAYVRAQSIVQRLNAVLPGRWTQTFQPVAPNGVPLPAEAPPPGTRMYLLGTLTVCLPHAPGGPDVEVVYQDVGEFDAGSSDALKALYSDARKRSAVPAGVGAYLYTSMPRIVLPVVLAPPAPPHEASPHVLVQSEWLVLPAATDRWLRTQYAEFVKTVEHDLGPVLSHGEAEDSQHVEGEPVATPIDARLAAAAQRLREAIPPPEEREQAATGAAPAQPPAPVVPPAAPAPPAAEAAPPAAETAPPAAEPAAKAPAPAPADPAPPVLRHPPPAPVQPIAQPPAGAEHELGATASLAPLTPAQQQWICDTATARGMTKGQLANLIISLTGGQQRSDEVAGRVFDDGLLANTPAYLFERIRAGLDPAQQQLPTAPPVGTDPVPAVAGAGTNGHVSVDFRGLGAP